MEFLAAGEHIMVQALIGESEILTFGATKARLEPKMILDQSIIPAIAFASRLRLIQHAMMRYTD